MLLNKAKRFLVDKYFKRKSSHVTQGMGFHYEESVPNHRRGDVFFELRDASTGELLEERQIKNVITLDFSILLARLLKNPIEPSHGIFALAMGTGDTGWDLQAPPTETNTQRALYSEIERKGFVESNFIDSNGSPTSIPTNVIEFSTFFNSSEAVGPLVEMGLVGGDLSDDLSTLNPISPANGVYDDTVDVRNFDMLCNYLTFPVINKPSSATLRITWRITL